MPSSASVNDSGAPDATVDFASILPGLWTGKNLESQKKTSDPIWSQVVSTVPDVGGIVAAASIAYSISFSREFPAKAVPSGVITVPRILAEEQAQAFMIGQIAEAIAKKALEECDHSQHGHEKLCSVPTEACQLLRRIDEGDTIVKKEHRNALLSALLMIPAAQLKEFRRKMKKAGGEVTAPTIAAAFGVPNFLASIRLEYDKASLAGE